jgi:L-asparagine transporter-like permease
MSPKRQTRRRIAYALTGCIIAAIMWVLSPGDIGQNESSLMMLVVPSLVGGLIGFITGETYSDHSARKNGVSDD